MSNKSIETAEIKLYAPVKTKAMLQTLARESEKSMSEFILDAAIEQYLKPKNKKPAYHQSHPHKVEGLMPEQRELKTTEELIRHLDPWATTPDNNILRRQLHQFVTKEPKWISAYSIGQFKPKEDRLLLDNPDTLQAIAQFTNDIIGKYGESSWLPVKKVRTDYRVAKPKKGKPFEQQQYRDVSYEWVYATIGEYLTIPHIVHTPKFFIVRFDAAGKKLINGIN
jgi:hypothetical protein